MATKVMTAPLAIIKVNGVAVGKMKSIRVSETISRGFVQGIGELTPQELPALKWNGTLNAGFYSIKFNNQDELIKNALLRNVSNPQEFIDTVLLQENCVQIDIMRKVKDYQDPATGIIYPQLEVFATIRGAFASKEGFDISEGQISGRDVDFEYMNPIIFSL
ncbi:MAG: hypothetical protein ABIN48_06105 [Ginsengibacter sp.]